MAIKIPVDFSGVPERGSIRVPEGDYLAKAVKVDKTTAKSSGNPMLVVTFELRSGPKEFQGKRIVDRHILIQDSLWTLRNMLEAMGYKVPASKMTLKDEMILNKSVGLSIVDGEEHKGRIKSEVADYISPSSVGNKVTEDEDDDDWEDEDEEEVEVEDDSEEESDDEDEEDEDFDLDDEEEDDEEDEEEEVALSFDPSDIESAKGAELKKYLKEAMEAGFDFDELDAKPKVAEVRKALLNLFDEDDDDEMEEFSLDDV